MIYIQVFRERNKLSNSIHPVEGATHSKTIVALSFVCENDRLF